ncbi:hypothetical protein WICMUC_002976 [Wickerhamomyces mucosus]|uniref:Uncharacterized protein n=1 Tax=Wickerhamomyces mucosus TaxID=1378264 RepID=A0A9P8PMK5_9ASCO|nr:hypothetical protein WICMUC_002976 [Wickerhamomyces mucosus]
MSDERLKVNPSVHAIAGGLGGALSMVVTYPLVTLSTLAQTNSKKIKSKDSKENDQESSNILKSIKSLYANDGILGFYSGLESALFGIIINNIVYYYFYELFTKIVLTRKTFKKGLSSIESILIGALAGSITVFSTNPIWVANTRITVSSKNNNSETNNNDDDKNQSTLGALLKIIKQDGILSLFSGVLPALILVINPIIQYTFFEQIKNLINKKRGKLTSSDVFFLGAIGKLLATGSTYPYITLKSRMHLQNPKNHQSLFQLISKIYQREGLRGFYNGIEVKLSQSVATAAFLFLFKEQLIHSSVGLLKFITSINNLNKSKRTYK